MKANELIIGDWLYSIIDRFDHTEKKLCKVTGIMTDSDVPYIQCDDTDVWYSLDSYEPIPLTLEILEKNGFKKFDFHDIEGQHQWSWWLDTLTSVSLWCRELNDDPKDGWMIRIEGTLAMCCHKVEYVHELQQTLRICGVDKEIEL